MRHITPRTASVVAARLLVGTLVTVALAASLPRIGHATQFIASLGYTKAIDSSGDGGKFSGGLALRAPLLPFLSAEGGINYRDESYSNGDLKVRMWPVTASLWLTPVPMLYAGGGLGWYHTTYDYSDAILFDDTTTNKVGIHMGGGLAMPLSPAVGLDLNVRYIFMQEDNNVQLPTKFNPDFWNTSLGLALKF